MRRVEEAKKIMEAQMLEEMERRKQEQLEEARRREVRILLILFPNPNPNAGSEMMPIYSKPEADQPSPYDHYFFLE